MSTSATHAVSVLGCLILWAGNAYGQLTINTPSNLGSYAIGPLEIQLSASGGTGTYSWSLINGTLPGGLALRQPGDVTPGWPPQSTGLIGVATTPGNYSFTLQVSSGAATASRAFTVTIHDLLILNNTWLVDGFVGVPYSNAFESSRSPVTWTATGPLPPGMSLSAAGVLSGTPTAPGNFPVPVSVTDGVNTYTGSPGIKISQIHITTPGNLPNATQGVPYSVSLAANGGTPPYTWTTTWLPSGFALSPDGTLSGTPTYAFTNAIPITVTDANQLFYTKTFSLNAPGRPPLLPTLYLCTDNLVLGSFWSCAFSVSGGTAPYTWSAQNLPPGMSLRTSPNGDNWIVPGQGQFWGTPLAAGTYDVTISVSDSSAVPLTVTNVVPIKVSALNLFGLPNGTLGQPYSGQVYAEGGSPGYSWLVLPGDHFPAGTIFDAASGRLTGTPVENGWFNPLVQVTDSAGATYSALRWLFVSNPNTTLYINSRDVTQIVNQQMNQQLSASASASVVWSVVPGNTLPAGILLSAGGKLSGTPTTAGTYKVLVQASDASNPANFAVREISFNITPLQVTSGTPPYGNVARPYAHTFAASGGTAPLTWSLTRGSVLPPGITLSPAGVLAGTPLYSGSFNFGVEVTDAAGFSNSASYTLPIYAAGTTLPLSLPPITASGWPGAYFIPLNAQGGTPPYTYSSTPSAPAIPGARVQSGQPLPCCWGDSGGYLGIITAPGSYQSSVRVTDSAGATFDAPVSVSVAPVAPTAQTSGPNAYVSVPYSFPLTATGGTPPYTWTVADWSVLAPGLSLSSSGVISGTPSTAGTYWTYITLADAAGNSVASWVLIAVNAISITSPVVLPPATAQEPYSFTFTANGTPPLSWTLNYGNIGCANPTLDASTGVLTVTPNCTGGASFQVRVVDANGRDDRRKFSVRVNSSSPQPLSGAVAMPAWVRLGDSVAARLTEYGGTPPYSWAVSASSSLPAGLSLAGPGETLGADQDPGFLYIAGRAMALGTYSFSVTVSDSAGASAVVPVTLLVSPISIETANLPSYAGPPLTYGSSYNQMLLAVGGNGSYTWSAQTPFPPGLSLNAAGRVSGTPTNTGFFNAVVQVCDSSGAVLSNYLNLNIASGTEYTLDFNSGPDLGAASMGSSYFRWIAGTGSGLQNPNYTISLTPGANLPPGITLRRESSNYALAGTPLSAGTYQFALRVQDAGGNFGVKTFTLRISSLTILTATLSPASSGVAFSQQLVAIGGSQNWSLAGGSALPAGVTLSSSGVLSGTPTTPGNYYVEFSVTDANGVAISRSYSLNVSPLAIRSPRVLPAATVGVPYSYTLQASGGGGNLTWSGSVPYGFTLSAGGVLSGTAVYASGYNISISVTDGTSTLQLYFLLPIRNANPSLMSLANATLRDATAGFLYSDSFFASGGVPPYRIAVAPASTLPPGLSLIPQSVLNPWSGPGNVQLIGVPTATGDFPFQIAVTDAIGETLIAGYTLHVSPLSVQYPPAGVYGSAYNQPLTVLGGTPPYSFALADPVSNPAPAGLALSPAGTISGTLLFTGYQQMFVRVTDAQGQTLKTWVSIQSNPATSTMLTIYGSSTSDAQTGQDASVSVFAYGGVPPYTWSLDSGSLPPGMSLQSDGWVLGVINQPGRYQYGLRATDSAGNFGVSLVDRSAAPIQIVTRGNPPTFRVGVPVNYPLPIAGSNPPFTVSLAATSALPGGLALSSSGVLTGTPIAAGLFNVSLNLTDTAGNLLRTYTPIAVLNSSQVNPLNVSSMYVEASVGTPYALALDPATQGGVPPFQWTLQAGAELPAGLTLAPASASSPAAITGVPATAGDFTTGLVVRDSAGQSANVRVTTQVSSLSLTPARLPPATVGRSYSVSLMAAGGQAPYQVQLSRYSGMPPGLSFQSGTLSGTPTQPGLFNLAFGATDNTGATIAASFTLVVDSPATPVPGVSLSPDQVQVTYDQGGPAPAPVALNVSATAANLAFGMAVSGIQGAALSAAAGTAPATVTLTFDSNSLALLAPGTYHAAISLTAASAYNAPLAIPVILTVLPPAPCSYSWIPGSATVPAAGNSGSVSMNAGAGCGWTATASDPWIRITSGSSGTGAGSLEYTVAPNGGATGRSGSITAGGATFSITQFGAQCAFTLDQANLNAPAGGGSAAINVTASGGSCSWTANNNLGWVTVPNPSGTGSGPVTLQIAANPDALSRSGNLTIAGQTVAITQAGTGCAVTLSAAGVNEPSGGGSGSLTVTTSAGCSYTTNPGPSWITVTSGGSGSGPSATLNYTVAANSTTQARSGALVIGGQIFQITQDPVACSFTVSSNLDNVVASAGASGTVTLTAAAPSCAWGASSNVAWLSLAPPVAGSGSAALAVSVAPNAGLTPRSGTLTVGGQTVTVNQAGVTCSYGLLSSTGSVPAAGGNASVGVTAPAACSWTASSNASWLAVPTSGGSGGGSVQFSATQNTTGADRSGTLTIAELTYTVTQAPVACPVTLGFSRATVAPSGAVASFPYSVSGTSCTAPAVSSTSGWVSAADQFNGTSGTVTYTVSANALYSERSAHILVGDQVFTVAQTAAPCSYTLNTYGASYDHNGGSGAALGSASAQGCTPVMGATPPLILGAFTEALGIFTQNYTVPPYSSLVPFVQTLQISFSGIQFTIKQSSW